MQNGFIKVPRAIERFSEFGDFDVLAAYLKLRFLARFREGFVDGILVRENQVLISKPALADSLKFTVHKVRRILQLFEKMGGIRCENVKNKYTLITLLPLFTGENTEEYGRREAPSPCSDEAEAEDIFGEAEKPVSYSSSAADEEAEAPTQTDSRRGPLKAYGKFENVMISEKEYLDFVTEFADGCNIIEKFSAFLVNHKGAQSENHFAKLWSRALYDRDQKKASNESREYGYRAFGGGESTERTESSYDLKRAEMWAKTHKPDLSKRR